MPMPQEYQIASQEFEKLLEVARNRLELETRNQTYTTIQSVLIIFRRRLRPSQVLQFADVFPAVLRAIFVQGWSEAEFIPCFSDIEKLTREVQSFRRNHNFSPDNSIPIVTSTIRDYVEECRLDSVLRSISPEAQLFWAT